MLPIATRRSRSTAARLQPLLRCVVMSALLVLTPGRALAASPDTSTSARLTGRVLERGASNPADDTTVSIDGSAPVTADSKGHFAVAVTPGEHRVVVEAPGYKPLSVLERLAPGETLTVEYRLDPLSEHRRRYRSVIRGESRHESQRFTLTNEELYQVPGSLGDPFRVIASLPGVGSPLPLLPLYVVRGASPGLNGFYLDGMRVPQLFHFLLIGGGVIHPRLVERLDFYPGAYDASFGHNAGGIIDATTRPARSDAPLHFEGELRLYDVSALVELRLPRDVHLTVAGHYGYPGPLIRLIDPRVGVSYGDYQLRLDWHGLTIEALGSYDAVSLARELLPRNTTSNQRDEYNLTFHRVQAVYRARRGRVEFQGAVGGGFDRTVAFSGQGVDKLAVFARFNVRAALPYLRLEGGVDGELSRFTGRNIAPNDSYAAPDQFGDLAGPRTGVIAGAYAQATLVLDRAARAPLRITLGGRIDTYHAARVTLLGLEPRLTWRYEPTRWLYFQGGIGLHQQPPSFPVPLPGIDTYALQLGLQRAWQGASGLGVRLPQDFKVELTGFYTRFLNVNETIADTAALAVGCGAPPPESLGGIAAQITRQIDGNALGMELLVRRQSGRVTGWVAYTLSRAERAFSCGLRPSDYDQRHILNVVVQAQLPWRLVLGGRFYLGTGRPYTRVFGGDRGYFPVIRNNARFPDFFELDIRLDREWLFRRWAIAAFIEVANATDSRSVLFIRYPESFGTPQYLNPQFVGFRFILPSLGVRGRF